MNTKQVSNPFYGKNNIENSSVMMKKWIFLFVVSFVIPFMISFPLIFEMISSGCGLYLIIFASIFSIGVFFNLKLLLRIAFESDVLYRRFDKIGVNYEFKSNDENSILNMHIYNLKKMFVNSNENFVSQDSLIEILHNKLNSEGRIVLLFSNIMITIGLVGTISGLISSIGGLRVVSEGSGFMGGLGSTLNGVGVAFYTTLIGSVLGGICLRVLFYYVNKKVDSYILNLAEAIEIQIIPIFRKKQNKNNLTKTISSVIEALNVVGFIRKDEKNEVKEHYISI